MEEPRTQKGRETQNRIVSSAIELFERDGYAATTLRGIAAHAGVSTGLAYRYFSSKEELVLALYGRLSAEFSSRVAELEPGPWPARFNAALSASFLVLQPHRDTIGSMLGAMFSRRGDGIYIPWVASQDQVRQGFVEAVRGARNPPANPERFGEILYLVQLATLLFWTLDRSRDQVATARLRGWIARTAPVLGTALRLPLVRGPIQSLVTIVQQGIYGESPPSEVS